MMVVVSCGLSWHKNNGTFHFDVFYGAIIIGIFLHLMIVVVNRFPFCMFQHNARGILAMANSGPNTNGSQFFLTYAKQPHLNGLYTVFGKVIHGFEVLDLMEKVFYSSVIIKIVLSLLKKLGCSARWASTFMVLGLVWQLNYDMHLILVSYSCGPFGECVCVCLTIEKNK